MSEKQTPESDALDLEKHRDRAFGISHQEALQMVPGLTTATFGKEVTIIAGGGGKEAVNKPLDLARIRAAMDPLGATGFASQNTAKIGE
jgi:hypothetical protein